MSATHDQRHEERVRAVFLGDLSRDAPDVAELLASCAVCRERLEALEGAVTTLDDAASAQAEELAAAAEPTADEPDVAAMLERIAADEPYGSPPSRRALWIGALVLTAAAVALVFFSGLFGGPRERRPIYIGSEQLHLLAPDGEVDAFDTFEWTYDGGTRARTTCVSTTRERPRVPTRSSRSNTCSRRHGDRRKTSGPRCRGPSSGRSTPSTRSAKCSARPRVRAPRCARADARGPRSGARARAWRARLGARPRARHA